MEESMIRVHIKNSKPVEVIDFTRSLTALAEEYQRHLKREDPDVSEEVKLYIKEVRTGCIIADLIQMADAAMPFLGDANTVAGFVENMGKLIGIFRRGEMRDHEGEITQQTAKNIGALVEPVAKDPGGILQISNSTITGDVNLSINIDTEGANSVQNNVNRFLSKDSEGGFEENMVLYWYQTRKDFASSAGDRAIIESLSPDHVKTQFGNETIKRQMLMDVEHPYKCAYLVDVHVQTAKGKPMLYTITNYRENLGEIS